MPSMISACFSSPCFSDLQRRGIYRTAFEFARLLLSLDPWSDPHGAYLHLDFLAIKSGMHSWLLSFSEIFSPVILKKSCSSSEVEPRFGHAPVCALPGWAYAKALALRAEGDNHVSQVWSSVSVDKYSHQLIETRYRAQKL